MPRITQPLTEADTLTIKSEDLKAMIDKANAEKAKADAEKNTAVDEADDSSDKIMGIPKTGFYIGLGVLVILGGYFGYKKFIAKK